MSRCTKFSPGGSITSNRTNNFSFNTYKPGGGGIGGSSISNRRAKNRLSTVCQSNNCFPCYMDLGKYSHNPNGFVDCSINETVQPKKNPLIGSLIFTFDFVNQNARTFTLGSPPSPELIEAILPMVTVTGVFEIKHKATITSTNVIVEIETFLYEDPEVISPYNFGLYFNKTYIDPDLPGPPIQLVDFYNSLYNLTFISATNCPFYQLGSQFKGLTQDFTILPTFTPLFMKGTSLYSCFSGCTNFNSDISFWNVSSITDMSNMFENASQFNQNIGGWNVSNVTNMSEMFQNALAFNNGETGTLGITGTATSAFYTTIRSILTCPGATFLTELTTDDVLIIRTSTIMYSSKIETIISNTALKLKIN
jgi:surface protein